MSGVDLKQITESHYEVFEFKEEDKGGWYKPHDGDAKRIGVKDKQHLLGRPESDWVVPYVPSRRDDSSNSLGGVKRSRGRK